MSANHRTVDNRAGLIDLDLQVSKDGSKVALACPVCEAVVHAFPGAEALGQVTPGKARLGPEQHGIDEQAVAAAAGGELAFGAANVWPAAKETVWETAV